MLEDYPIMSDEDSYYNGSRAFLWLADLCGLSVDLVNFLLCQVAALFLASLFRSFLHPSKVSSAVRHTFGLSLGLVFGYICFGQQAIHIAGLPSVCYIVIRTQNPAIVQKTVMIVAMSYLLCIHLHRQIYDYGSYALDITGPLMIITQKVTSLAFSIHDGFTREQKDLTKAQQYHAVQKLPSALEYFSYVLHFQSLLAGPLIFYRDYIEFIEGYNLLKSPTSNGNMENVNSKEIIIEPSPTKAVIKKVVGSLVCAFIYMKFVKVYPVKNLKDPEFIETSSITEKFWWAMMATTIVRFKYYHAWLLADAICNNSGLGFTGYDKDGNSKWDLISNINILSFELASNFREAINNWNIGTNIWLRTVVYERVPKKYGTAFTFGVSALWHGFYPGYYLTFATGALFVSAGRNARRMFRHRFQRTQFTRMFYDILTCLTTRIFMGYTTFPFVLLEFMGSVKLYLNLFMCLHITAMITNFVLIKFIRGEKRQKASIGGEHSINGRSLSINGGDNIQAVQTFYKVNEGIPFSKNNDETSNVQKRIIIDSGVTQRQPPISVPTALAAISVAHDQCEMDNLSTKLKEKIDMEARNIEEFIDKTVNETVSGIVEFKNDLMRDSDKMFISPDGLRKRTIITDKSSERVDVFLKKEIDAINAVVQQTNVLPVVLSNGHAK